MSEIIVSQCCEHCLFLLHCNSFKKSRCSRFLSYIRSLHLSNAHQELIAELKNLIDMGSKYSLKRRTSV